MIREIKNMTMKTSITAEEHAALNPVLQEEYKANGDGFRLDVTGTDEAIELKEALRKEREQRAAAKTRVTELEKANTEAERLRLEEKGQYKTLYEASEGEKATTAKELADLKVKIANGERNASALKVAHSLTKDTGRAALLTKEALQFITHTPDGVKMNGSDGSAWTPEQLSTHLTAAYPFLVDGSQASGGGATGGAGGGAADLSNLPPTDRITAHRQAGGKQ